MGSLSNLYISQSYTSLIHLGNDTTITTASVELQDGLGNGIGVFVNSLGNLRVSGSLTSSLQDGYILVGGADGKTYATPTSSISTTINTGSLVTTASFNAYTASTDSSITQLNASSASQQVSIDALNTNSASVNISITNVNSATASLFTSVNRLNLATASLNTSASLALTTASFSGNTLTFTKGNGTTFGIVIPDNSGSLIPDGTVSSSAQILNYGIFATTGSNTFRGNQTLQSGNFTWPNGFAITAPSGDIANMTSNTSIQFITEGAAGPGGTNDIKFINRVTGSSIIFENRNGGSGNRIDLIGGEIRLQPQAISGSNGKITVNSSTTQIDAQFTPLLAASITSSGLLVNGNLTASLQQGYVWVGNAAGTSVTVPTSSFSSFTSGSIPEGTISSSAQITALGFVSSSVTASSLVTASFNGNTLTFTKGDNTTFGIVIPDVSGSTINTGSFVTTSSFNDYTSSNDQRVSSLEANSASVNTSISNINSATASLFTSASLAIVTASVSNDDITFTKGDGSQFTIQVATGSFAVSASYADNAATASISRNVVVVARNGGASTLAAGTVVHITSAVGDNPVFTTASYDNEALSSNTFGILRYSSAAGADVEVVVSGVVTGVNTDPALGYAAGDILYLSSSGQFTNVQPQAPNQIVTLGQVLRAQQNNGSIYVSINNGWELNELHNVQITSPTTGQLLAYESASYGLWKNKSASTLGLATTGSNIFIGDQTITGSFSTNAGITVGNTSAQYNSVNIITSKTNFPGNVYNAFNINTDGDGQWSAGIAVSTYTGYGSEPAFTLYGGGLGNAGTNNILESYGNLLQINKNTKLSGSLEVSASLSVNGSPVVVSSQTGSFATTGSNLFRGDQIYSDATANTVTLQSYSGSFVLTSKGIASGSSTLSHLTSSANQVNLIFKGSAAVGETVISGSNNLFANQSNPTTGFRKLITNGNIGLAGTALPQFSSSMAFSPAVNSNYFANSTAIPFTARGPVSSSAYTIANNGVFGGQINLGTSATLNFEKAANGLTLSNNIVNGTLNVTAYKTTFVASPGSAMAISACNIGGGVTLNADSSSITLAGATIQNATLRVDNSYYNPSATGGGGSFQITQGNAIFGTQTTIYTSGSNTTNATGRQFTANLLAGTFVSASLNLNGDNSNIFATAIIGHGLNVTGSAALQTGAPVRSNTYGSAFFGRFNAEDGTRARTAETVFAVGTGTTTTPKTGFLIDSGSNTFVEGTLNVSGSTVINGNTTITGSLILSSSAAIELNVIGNVSVSGSINVNSGSYNGQAVTNITPVSSSLSPILNIVTMTSAEYALITPNSQTLYVII